MSSFRIPEAWVRAAIGPQEEPLPPGEEELYEYEVSVTWHGSATFTVEARNLKEAEKLADEQADGHEFDADMEIHEIEVDGPDGPEVLSCPPDLGEWRNLSAAAKAFLAASLMEPPPLLLKAVSK